MKIVIPIKPVTKKNSQQICYNSKTKRSYIVQSKQYQAYEKQFLKSVHWKEDPISAPVNVQMVFFLDTKRRCDLVNLEEACLDCLTRAGVIADDCYKIVRSMDGSCVMYDRENPRTEVLIEYI